MHSVVVAHQGGWDEIALVGGPLVVFAALLAIARRRAIRQISRAQEATVEERRD